MAMMKFSRTLQKDPNGEIMNLVAMVGTRVEVLEKKESFTKVKLVRSEGAPVGWVSSDAVDEAAEPAEEPIDKAHFARECWHGGLRFGVNAHYMMAIAEHRSRIRNDHEGGKIGPFRLTQMQWNAHRGDQEFRFNFDSVDIHHWGMQCDVFALMTFRAQNELIQALGGRPTALQLYKKQLAAFGEPVPASDQQLTEDLDKALRATATFIQQAGTEVLADALTALTPPNAGAAQISLTRIPAGREEIAKLIISKFAEAGYGKIQQVAALANAIRESNLNPNAHNQTPPESSVGLFQLNRNGGLGTGHEVAALKDPAFNISLIIREAKKFDAFKNAASLFDAVDVFVRKVERPANQTTEVQKRVEIAKGLTLADSLVA